MSDDQPLRYVQPENRDCAILFRPERPMEEGSRDAAKPGK